MRHSVAEWLAWFAFVLFWVAVAMLPWIVVGALAYGFTLLTVRLCG